MIVVNYPFIGNYAYEHTALIRGYFNNTAPVFWQRMFRKFIICSY